MEKYKLFTYPAPKSKPDVTETNVHSLFIHLSK